jgi:hypothetical protein
MSPAVADPETGLRRTARRITRLFRIERIGRLERRPAATIRRLITRRGALIDALIAAERRRRSDAETRPPALEQAFAELALEVGECRPSAERRLFELAAELRLRRGEVPPTGLRPSIGGQLLGRG